MQANEHDNRNTDLQENTHLIDDIKPTLFNDQENTLANAQIQEFSSDEPNDTIMIDDSSEKLIFKISDRPPIQSMIMFAFQNLLLALPWNITVAILVAEVTCAREDQDIKATLLSTTILVSGLTTLVQVSVGVRLPVYQGPTSMYVVPLITMMSLDEWKCVSELNSTSLQNGVTSNVSLNVYTENRENVTLPRLRLLQGSLIVAGAIHALIGLTGIVGAMMRFIGPITIIPTIFLIGIAIYTVMADFCSVHWGLSGITFVISLVLCLFLAGKNSPIPMWTKEKGFHIVYFPFQQVLSMLLTILLGWGIAGIFTAAGVFPNDNTHPAYNARTDARSNVIKSSPWFYVPYPGQFGMIGFHPGLLVAFLTATFTSIIDSIMDYYTCAKMSRVPPPPVHAVNRGITIEGLMCAVSGFYGTGHGTTTFGQFIGSIGITRVASRHVYQTFAVMMTFIAVVGKVAAVFVTIPYPVLGGSQIVGLGVFLGLILSNIQYTDIHSTRNLAIIGVSIMVGLMVPYWAINNQKAFETGYAQLDGFLKTILTNPNLAGGVLACFLDNTVPGTLKERGMIEWATGGSSADGKMNNYYEEGLEVYEIPYLTRKLENVRFLRKIPFLPTYKK